MDRRSRVIEHVTVNAAGRADVIAFYRAALEPLALAQRVDAEGRLAFGDDGEFGVYGTSTTFFQEPHVAFAVATRGLVDACHRAALASGGETVDAPRERPEFGAGTYSCYVRDPAGDMIEFVMRGPSGT